MPIAHHYYSLVGYLLSGNYSIISLAEKHLKPEYLQDPFLSEIVNTAYQLYRNGKSVDLLTVSQVMIEGTDKEFKQKIKDARNFFASLGDLDKKSTNDEVAKRIPIFLASCLSNTGSGYEFSSIVAQITKEYVDAQRQALTSQFNADIKRNPGDYSIVKTFTSKIEELETLLLGDAWKDSQLDLRALKSEKSEDPLIMRGNDGFIRRDDIHMISGPAGSMKSLMASYFGAAALNDGLLSESTLGLYASAEGLKVGYIDTELGKSTIQRRLQIWEAACGQKIYDPSRFNYLSVASLTKKERCRRTFDFIKNSACDIIIVDGLRDLCVDFNDAAEASELADTFKRLAESLHKAIIVTSHTSKGVDFSRGHLGSQFNDLVALEITLKTEKNAFNNISKVKISYNKARHGMPQEFTVRFDPDQSGLVLTDLLEDIQELSRSQKRALEYFEKAFTPGREYTFSEATAALATVGVPSNTGKKYLNEAKGTTLIYTNRRYKLPVKQGEISFEEDLPY